jgi:geranylgeranyl diphosphate synthase type I
VSTSHPIPAGTTRPDAPPSLDLVAARVADRLDRLFDAETARWAEVDADLVEPIEAVRLLVAAGGKRLRPAFCFWGFVAAGGDPEDPLVDDLGAAFEMLHAFALIHDDIVDDSATRRGRQTMHLDFGDLHDRQAFRGERRRFGEGVAVLVGDLTHVYADVLLEQAPPSVWPLWNELRVELNVGQFLDLLGTARGDTDLARATRIARYKSAKYTIERPLHLGAAGAGGLAEQEDLFTQFGVPLGEAFQLRDDLLGVFGDASVTGKPVGDDLREGKPTPLLALAVERADAAQREVLGAVGTDADGEAIAAMQAVLLQTGAVDAVVAMIDERRDRAVAAIAGSAIAASAKDALVELADFVSARQH